MLEKRTFWNRWCWENWISICRRWKQDIPCPSLMYKNQFQINLRPKWKARSCETAGRNASWHWKGENFFFPLAPQNTGNKRNKIDKCDFIKLNSFWAAKGTIHIVKRQPTNWEIIFSGSISDWSKQSFFCKRKTYKRPRVWEKKSHATLIILRERTTQITMRCHSSHCIYMVWKAKR